MAADKVGTVARVALLAACAFWLPGKGAVAQTDATAPSVEVIADGLDYPWDIVANGEDLILTEAAGTIVMIRQGRVTRVPLQTSEPIAREGGSGLLGIALSPDFPTSGLAYLYHSYRAGSELANKVIEARHDGTSWRETRVLIAGIPGHRLYNGGRVAFGPDRYLYITTGWTENPALPQDLKSLAGKVLRLGSDGSIPADNPFPGSPVYSYGHRNPQGLAWDGDGTLFVAEHGQIGFDEINIVRPGRNYGWPVISGDERREGMETPLVHSGRETWAPSGIAFDGRDLLVTGLQARSLLRLDPQSKTLRPLFSTGERYRAVLPVADGLYLITTNRSPRGQGPSRDRLIKVQRGR